MTFAELKLRAQAEFLLVRQELLEECEVESWEDPGTITAAAGLAELVKAVEDLGLAEEGEVHEWLLGVALEDGKDS